MTENQNLSVLLSFPYKRANIGEHDPLAEVNPLDYTDSAGFTSVVAL